MLKLPSPFLSASVKVCFNHMRGGVKQSHQENSIHDITFVQKYKDRQALNVSDGAKTFNKGGVTLTFDSMQKDIGHGYAASSPDCPRR